MSALWVSHVALSIGDLPVSDRIGDIAHRTIKVSRHRSKGRQMCRRSIVGEETGKAEGNEDPKLAPRREVVWVVRRIMFS
jgi:hypothetical protein